MDFGCGFGYSTLAFALMADQLMKNEKVNPVTKISIVGVDVYSEFIEKSIVNYQKYKKHITNNEKIIVDFKGKQISSST